MSEETVSVIVRARDEAASIGRCLELLHAQTNAGAREVIVVDAGSRDATASIARSYGARVISIAEEEFTFGGALNLGAANSDGEILVALSADAFLPDTEWLFRLLAHFADPRVACACGGRYLPDGTPLRSPMAQDLPLARAEPQWGYSNDAGAFRARLWRERPFRADLTGCEDKEWALHWLSHGYLSIIDPSLAADHDHTHDPLPALYRRARREAEGFASYLELPSYRARDALRDWWSDMRFYDSSLRARLSHRRAAWLLGTYAGRRRVQRRGGS